MKPYVFLAMTCIGLAGCGAVPKDNDRNLGGSAGSGSGVIPPPGGQSDPNLPDPGTAPKKPTGHDILVLDFRSGWWAGSAGDFHRSVLDPLHNLAKDITIEFHHFTVGSDVKCIYPAGAPGGCQNLTMSPGALTPEQIVEVFDKDRWDDYTQVWLLSGSEQDQSDIQVSGDLFGHFIGQAGSSCIPVFIGAGDGFIDHGNALSSALGIGPILSTELPFPGFFFGGPAVAVESHMDAGTFKQHALFENVHVVADGVANFLQHAHGDSLVDNPLVETIAHDSAGRPVIGVGSIPIDNGLERPFVLDAGLQRYYSVATEADTLTLLENILKYLASTGCRANPIIPA